jgi:hypothetical protein
MSRLKSVRVTAVVLVVVGLAVAAPGVMGDTVNITIASIDYTLPGNVQETGSGSGTFDTDTGLGSGSVTFSQGPNVSPLWIQIPAAIWIVLHFPSRADFVPSLRDLSNNNLTATLVSNMGSVGTATYNVSIVNDVATISADLSGLNFGAAPPSTTPATVTGTELAYPTGPGTAAADDTLSLDGFGPLATDEIWYGFPGNPTGLLVPSRLILTSATVTQAGPTTFTFSGQASVSAVPEPASLVIAGTSVAVGLGYWWRTRRRAAA